MKKPTMTIFFILAGCVLLLSGIWIYFQKMMERVDLVELRNSTEYDRHYVLIADDGDSMLWESIYESASREAAATDACLELIRPDDTLEYTQEDCLRIAIASRVDGIILKPDGSTGTQELIVEASKAGIPVVTALEDDSTSQRISFVGLNSYQMGDAYVEQVLRLLKPGQTEIMILADSEGGDVSTGLVSSYIVRAVEQRKASDQAVEISVQSVDSSSDFNAEEAVRDIFMNEEGLPDILICMDEVITECAYQALVDFNEVGNVDIIGFYYSDMILDAVVRGTVPATIALDMEEIGRYSVDALNEYLSLGHASSYYSVDLNVITQGNAAVFMSED